MKTTAPLLKLAFLVSVFNIYGYISHLKAEENTMFFELYCPKDYWVDCNDELWDLSYYGYAYTKDYTGKHYLYHPKVKYHLNSCNQGYITRTWEVYDYHGYHHSCTQTIHVGGSHGKPYIKWPKDYELEGCNPDVNPHHMDHDYGFPIVYEKGCSLIGVGYKDQIFNFGPGCKKIIRKWEVIDWCTYKPNNYSGGIWNHYQIIKISNSETPVVNVPPDTSVSGYNCMDATVFVDPVTVEDLSCGDYVQITNNSPYAFEHKGDASGIYPNGTTKVIFTVQYGCGSRDFYSMYITVKDHSSPVPICIGGLAIPLMPVFVDDDNIPDDGMAEIWAKDFDEKSYHPCYDGELQFSFSDDPNDAFRIFTCEQIGHNELQVWVTDSHGNQSFCIVDLDIQNNAANIPDCEPVAESEVEEDTGEEAEEETEGSDESLAEIFGTVSYYLNSAPVEDVMVTLESNNTDTTYHLSGVDTQYHEIVLDSFQNQEGTWLYIIELDTIIEEIYEMELSHMEKQSMSNESGDYSIGSLPMYKEYTLSADKDGFSPDGITPEDLQRLYEHAVNINQIEDPLVLISADVDDSGSVNFADVLILLDYLTGAISELPVKNQWIIINELIPLDSKLTEIAGIDYSKIEIDLFSTEGNQVNFTAVKKGDLVDAEVGSRMDFASLRAEILKESSDRYSQHHIIYPNPFSNTFNIEYYSAHDGFIKLNLVNTNGQIIIDKSYEVTEGRNLIQCTESNGIVPGIYHYVIRQEEKLSSGRVIKVDIY